MQWRNSRGNSQNLSDDKKEYEFFTQDGAPAHQSNNFITMLRIILRDWIITRHFGPARSTELKPRDYFLWKTLKDNAHKDNPPTQTHTQTKAHDELKPRASNRQFLDKNFNSFQ